MAMFKEQHESFVRFFAMPKREAIRDSLREKIGDIDHPIFNAAWPALPKLFRHILALADSDGGTMIVGAAQEADSVAIVKRLRRRRGSKLQVPHDLEPTDD